MKPRLTVARLVFVRRFISKALYTSATIVEFGSLTKPHTSVHSCGMPLGLHNGVRPSGTEPSIFESFLKGAVILLLWSHFATSARTLNVAGHETNVFFNHNSTDCSEDVLCDAAFFGDCIVPK